MEKQKYSWLVPFLMSFSLGLAPFQPEPHIVGKIRWIYGGAKGMQMIDWFDFLLHGAPWVWLIIEIITSIISYLRTK